jgi:hypothetical protein
VLEVGLGRGGVQRAGAQVAEQAFLLAGRHVGAQGGQHAERVGADVLEGGGRLGEAPQEGDVAVRQAAVAQQGGQHLLRLLRVLGLVQVGAQHQAHHIAVADPRQRGRHRGGRGAGRLGGGQLRGQLAHASQLAGEVGAGEQAQRDLALQRARRGLGGVGARRAAGGDPVAGGQQRGQHHVGGGVAAAAVLEGGEPLGGLEPAAHVRQHLTHRRLHLLHLRGAGRGGGRGGPV